MESANKLGLIAGGGDLPLRVVAACREVGRPVFVAALNGACDPETVAGVPHLWVDVGAVGKVVEALKAAQCSDVVLAGPVPRPDLKHIKPDWQGLRLLPKVVRAAARGDDAIIRTLVGFIESQGFRVIGADEVVKELLAPEGVLGKISPSESDMDDINRAIAVARALGEMDVGQAAIVRDHVVLGVEAVEGTNALIDRCGLLAPPGRGGVLVKVPKPGQERRVDLPTIGIVTIEKAVAARLNGIAVEAGGALILDRDDAVRRADAAGLFIYGLASGPPSGST
jgi:DUF1009 family protein